MPLEILPAGDFDPLYRTQVDVAAGELPALPLSIFGALAMAHLPPDASPELVRACQTPYGFQNPLLARSPWRTCRTTPAPSWCGPSRRPSF